MLLEGGGISQSCGSIDAIWFVCLLLLDVIATVFQLYHGGVIMFEMRRRKPKPTFLPTQGLFNLPQL